MLFLRFFPCCNCASLEKPSLTPACIMQRRNVSKPSDWPQELETPAVIFCHRSCIETPRNRSTSAGSRRLCCPHAGSVTTLRPPSCVPISVLGQCQHSWHCPK